MLAALLLGLLLRAAAILDSSHPAFSAHQSIARRSTNASIDGLLEAFRAPDGQWRNATRLLDMEAGFFDSDGFEIHMSALRVFTALDPLRTLSGSPAIHNSRMQLDA